MWNNDSVLYEGKITDIGQFDSENQSRSIQVDTLGHSRFHLFEVLLSVDPRKLKWKAAMVVMNAEYKIKQIFIEF